MTRLVYSQATRRGSASILMVTMMFVFLVTAAITIDYAYMQLIRTELRAATDAAAKAGAEALSRTQNSSIAIQEALRYAESNLVGGRPFKLRSSDVVIGRVTGTGQGKWTFQASGTPPNAVRIFSRTNENSANGPFALYFSRALGVNSFAPSIQATAGQQDVEICLCLDRSGSMNFDMTGEDYSFAANNPFLSSFTDWGWDWRNMLSRPHPTQSRWAALTRAIDLFLTTAGQTNPPPRASLVTWGTDYTMPISPFTRYEASQTDLALPPQGSISWDTNASLIKSLVDAKAALPIMGGTNLSTGLDRAVSVLKAGNPYSSKVVVLLTDGQWNAGRDPSLSAADARAAGIIVHCISMLTTFQSDLQEVAEITGGRYYGTSNEAQLRSAFEEIAKSLPVVLTE